MREDKSTGNNNASWDWLVKAKGL